MKKIKYFWLTVPFIVFIFGIGILNLLSKDKAESLNENRSLQQAPGIENIINRDYPKIYETYYTDQFINRDSLLKLYTKLQIKMNKSTVRGYYIIDNKWIMPNKVVKQKDEQIKHIADKVNEFSKKIKKDSREIYYISTPCKSQALDGLYPKFAGNGFALENVSKFGQNLDGNYINFINIDKYFHNEFSEKEKEKMYFKTDHHWNGIGAFEGFKYIIKNMNVLNENNKDLIDDSNFEISEITNKKFLGSYNRNLFSLFSKDENIPYVNSKERKKYEYFNNNGQGYEISDESKLISTEKNFDEITYGGAYTSDIPLYKIENKDAPINKKVLIVRDSYQAPTTLLFADLFNSVEILDPRNNIDLNVSKVVNESNPDVVVFMFNSETYGGMVDLIK
ncbi:MAG: alginate O-acetyltransferase AlgX-related protein [Paraclostridium sordellii]